MIPQQKLGSLTSGHSVTEQIITGFAIQIM